MGTPNAAKEETKKTTPTIGTNNNDSSPLPKHEFSPIMALESKFKELTQRGILSSKIVDLYIEKIHNFGRDVKSAPEIESGISTDQASSVLKIVENLLSKGFKNDQVNAIIAVGTGKGGAKGVENFIAEIAGKSPQEVIDTLKSEKGGWRESIVYLSGVVDEDGKPLFKSALESLFNAQEIEEWSNQRRKTNQQYYSSLNAQSPSRELGGKQISAEQYLGAPFTSGELGKKSADKIENMWLKPGGYCLENVQNALNGVGFGLGNLGPYAQASLPRFQSSDKFAEITGSQEKLEDMIKNRQLPPGAIVYCERDNDKRNPNGGAYGDVGIISNNGTIFGYGAGKLDANNQPRLVYGESSKKIQIFIPTV